MANIDIEEIDLEKDKADETTILFENIQTLCIQKKLKIKELARKAGIPENSIFNWRKSRCWMKQLSAVADVLEVTMGQLFQTDFVKNDNEAPMKKIITELQRLNIDDESADMIIDFSKVVTKKRRKQ